MISIVYRKISSVEINTFWSESHARQIVATKKIDLCLTRHVNGLFNFCRDTSVATVQPACPTMQLNASSIDNTSEPFDGDEYLLIGGMGRPLRIVSRYRCVPAAAPNTSRSTCEYAPNYPCSEWHVSPDRYPPDTNRVMGASNFRNGCYLTRPAIWMAPNANRQIFINVGL